MTLNFCIFLLNLLIRSKGNVSPWSGVSPSLGHGTRICNNTSNHFKSIKKSRLAKVAATIEDSDLKMPINDCGLTPGAGHQVLYIPKYGPLRVSASSASGVPKRASWHPLLIKHMTLQYYARSLKPVDKSAPSWCVQSLLFVLMALEDHEWTLKCWNAFNHWIKWGLPHGNQSAPTWALSTTPWGFAVLFGSHKMEHDKPNKNMADVRQGSTLLTGKKRLYSSICTLSPDLAHSMKCNESWAPSYPNK